MKITENFKCEKINMKYHQTKYHQQKNQYKKFLIIIYNLIFRFRFYHNVYGNGEGQNKCKKSNLFISWLINYLTCHYVRHIIVILSTLVVNISSNTICCFLFYVYIQLNILKFHLNITSSNLKHTLNLNSNSYILFHLPYWLNLSNVQ